MGMRIWPGTNPLTRETSIFEHTSTMVVAIVIHSAFDTEVVTARVGHIPMPKISMGFFFQMPLTNSCQ